MVATTLRDGKGALVHTPWLHGYAMQNSSVTVAADFLPRPRQASGTAARMGDILRGARLALTR